MFMPPVKGLVDQNWPLNSILQRPARILDHSIFMTHPRSIHVPDKKYLITTINYFQQFEQTN